DLLRVVNVPPRGIGQTTVDRLTAWATLNETSVFEALARIDEIGDLGPPAKKKLVAFRELLERLRAESEIAPSEMVGRVLSETGYVQALKKEDTAESDARIENLQELASSMQDYEAEAEAAGEAPSLAGFLERVTLVSDVDALPKPDGNGRADVPLQGRRSRADRRARRRAAPGVRGDHAREEAPLHDAYADAPDLRHDAVEPAEPLPRRASERGRRAPEDRGDDGRDAVRAIRRSGSGVGGARPAVAPPANAARGGAGAGQLLRRPRVLRRPHRSGDGHAPSSRRPGDPRPLRRRRGPQGGERRRAGGRRVLPGLGREEDP